MRLRHKLNPGWKPPSTLITPEYQAEIDRSLWHAQRDHRKAEQAFLRATLKLAKAEVAHAAKRELRVLRELVELRREELQQVEAMMWSVPASAQHRGHGGQRGHRPAVQPGRIV